MQILGKFELFRQTIPPTPIYYDPPSPHSGFQSSYVVEKCELYFFEMRSSHEVHIDIILLSLLLLLSSSKVPIWYSEHF